MTSLGCASLRAPAALAASARGGPRLGAASLRAGALILALAASLCAAEECRVPDPPSIPDGATAADGEMLRARAAVAAFVAGSDAYLRCLAEQIDSAEPNAPVAARFQRRSLAIWKERSD